MNLQDISRHIQGAAQIWWFLDYDGTLNDFAPTPETIEPNPEVIRLLGLFAEVPAFRTTILSGRPMSALQVLLPVRGIELAGTYGWEFCGSSGNVKPVPELERLRPSLEALKPQVESLVGTRRGFYLEDKGCALALHGRTASSSDLQAVMPAVERRFRTASSNLPFAVEQGDRFLEIFPSAARKRSFVRLVLNAGPNPGQLPVYIGDDFKDEAAFEEIQNRGGFAIRVLHDSTINTRADATFNNPAEVRNWLNSMAMRILPSGNHR